MQEARQQMDNSKEVRKQIRTLEEIPTLPGYFSKLMATLDDPDSGARDLAAIISEDASLTSKILKLANSAFYGRFKKVGTADQAVMTVGFREIRTVVMSISLFGAFANKIANETLENFWIHAVLTATGVQQLGDRKQETNVDKLYFGGLLHDIGKLVFCLLYGDQYLALVSKAEKESLVLVDAEKAAFGIHHGMVGGWLAERWHFPGELHEVITLHHSPKKSGVLRPKSIATVFLADHMAHGRDHVDLTDPLIAFSCQQLGVTEADIDRVCVALEKERERVAETFSLVG